MEINYQFIPEFKLEEEKQKKLIRSYAGKLLEICGASSLVVGLNGENEPFVLMSEGQLTDAFNWQLNDY